MLFVLVFFQCSTTETGTWMMCVWSMIYFESNDCGHHITRLARMFLKFCIPTAFTCDIYTSRPFILQDLVSGWIHRLRYFTGGSPRGGFCCLEALCTLNTAQTVNKNQWLANDLAYIKKTIENIPLNIKVVIFCSKHLVFCSICVKQPDVGLRTSSFRAIWGPLAILAWE